MHHHTGLCCIPCIQKVRVVEGNIVSNDETVMPGFSSPPGTSLLFSVSRDVMRFLVLYGLDSCYVAKDTIIEDGSTHGDIGTPLTGVALAQWPSAECFSFRPHFRRVKAFFIHIHKYVMGTFSFKLYYSLRKELNLGFQLHETLWYDKALQ